MTAAANCARTGSRRLAGGAVGDTLEVVWDDALAAYDFGPGHPFAPVRIELTMALARGLGVFDVPGVSLAVPEPCDALLELLHDPAYIAAVRRASRKDALPNPVFGLGTVDNPVFAEMHEASALVVGATVAAASAVWSGVAGHAVNLAGGLHHAMRAGASGFCVYNDPVIAIKWLLANGADRIGYVDLDVHHGDGVLAAFYADPRVLTISMHEHPRTLFPGPACRPRPVRARARGTPSTSRCPPAPAMRAGCGRSMRSSRRCCGYSGRRCWSASTAVTVTGWTRSPISI